MDHAGEASFNEPEPDQLDEEAGENKPGKLQSFLNELTALTRRTGLIIMGQFSVDPYEPTHDQHGSYLADPGGRVQWIP